MLTKLKFTTYEVQAYLEEVITNEENTDLELEIYENFINRYYKFTKSEYKYVSSKMTKLYMEVL